MWRLFNVFIVNFEQISKFALVFRLLNFNQYMLVGLEVLLKLVPEKSQEKK